VPERDAAGGATRSALFPARPRRAGSTVARGFGRRSDPAGSGGCRRPARAAGRRSRDDRVRLRPGQTRRLSPGAAPPRLVLSVAASEDAADAGALVLERSPRLTRQASEFAALCRRGPAQLGEQTTSFDLWASERIGVDV